MKNTSLLTLKFLTAHLPEKFFLDTSAFIKNRKGFTLVELVVVIAIIGILAGIAVPRFMEATASARGARIVADMRTIESAAVIYYAKNGNYPTKIVKDQATSDEFTSGTNALLTAWPMPPVGRAYVTTNTGKAREINVGSDVNYHYTYTAANADNPASYSISLGSTATNDLAGLMTDENAINITQ